MLVKSLSFRLIPQIQPMYRSTFKNIQAIENCMINEGFYKAELLISYKESFLDSILDSFIEMWEFGMHHK